MSAIPGEKSRLSLRRTAKETKSFSVLMKAVAVSLSALAVIITMAYAFALLYENFGSFTVSLGRSADMTRQQLSLSESPEFLQPITKLYCGPLKEATCISVNSLPDTLDSAENGQHNGDNYLAHTFYIKNTGKDMVSYLSGIYISGVTLNADAAIRVRVYHNGKLETYAKPRSDGTPEHGTTPFASSGVIHEEFVYDFKPGDIDKYTVVIWFEGDDEQCVDNIIGGTLKINMDFTIKETSGRD